LTRRAGRGAKGATKAQSKTATSDSSITANGVTNGGNISIAAAATPGLVYTGANPNVTATGSTGVTGSINTGPANSGVARSISALPASLSGAGLTLEPTCGLMLDLSTFLIQGRGSVSDEPGFWQTDLNLNTLEPRLKRE
jgi:hypothetical protein